MGDKIKNFFILHVEKMVLVLSVCLVAFFIWNGVGKTTYTKLPKQLVSDADSAGQNVETGSTWEQLREEESRDPERDFLADAQTGRLPTFADPYATPIPLAPITRRPVIKRKDPVLLAAFSLEATAIVGPVAMTKRPNQVDKIAELANADARPEKKVRKKSEPRRRGGEDSEGGFPRSGKSGRGGMEGFMPPPDEEGDEEPGMMGGGLLGGTGGSTTKDVARKLSKAFGDYHPGAPTGGGSMMGGGGGFMMSGRGGMMGNPSGEDGEDESSGMGGTTTNVSDLISGNANIIAVQALVPYRKQNEHFEEALQNTLGWDPSLDRLRYLWFSVERADVTADPTAEPQWDPNWKWNSWQAKAENESRFGKQRGPEFANPAYLLTELSMPVPPLMWRQLKSIALHSGIPSIIELGKEADTQDTEEKKPDDQTPGDFPPAFTGGRGSNDMMGGMMGSGMMGSGMMGSGRGGMMRSGMGGRPGMGGPLEGDENDEESCAAA